MSLGNGMRGFVVEYGAIGTWKLACQFHHHSAVVGADAGGGPGHHSSPCVALGTC